MKAVRLAALGCRILLLLLEDGKAEIRYFIEQRDVLMELKEKFASDFSIDNIPNSLHCSSEPHLLYLKAAVHALALFPLPDPLMLRTGTEEA